MRDDIEHLLELQKWDLETVRLEGELNSTAPQRAELVDKVLQGRERAQLLKQSLMQAEVARKGVESQIEQLQVQVGKYATQQLQTRKNDEYRAFQSQIETTRKMIGDFETQVLELMDAEEKARKNYQKTIQFNEGVEKDCKVRIKALDDLKKAHTQEVESRKLQRKELAERVDPALRHQYERMFKNKRGHVLVDIEGGACGGCHIKLPQQTILSCRSEEHVLCINCGCMLYYSEGMKLESED